MASLEMSDLELTARAIAQETGIPVEALATHDVNDREAAAVVAVAERQSGDPCITWMAPTGSRRRRSALERCSCRRSSVAGADRGRLRAAPCRTARGTTAPSRNQTLVSRNLKRMARALDVPLLVPVQINRRPGLAVTSGPSSATYASRAVGSRMPTWSSVSTATNWCIPTAKTAI
jgi:hypothetical protein